MLGRWPSHVECPSAKVCGYVVNCFYYFFPGCLFICIVDLFTDGQCHVVNVFDGDVSFLRTLWNGFSEVNHTLKLRPVINTEAI